MSAGFKKITSFLSKFLRKKKNRCILYLTLICLLALGDFLYSGLARRTFVFYDNKDGNLVVEGRLLRWSQDRETDIRRYVEEVLLGPVSPDSAYLFSRETRLHSFMYREGVVYADLTEPAALPPPEGGTVFRSLLTMNEGLRRNFPHVKDVRLFIGGNEVFFEEFRGFFAKSADNSKTSP